MFLYVSAEMSEEALYERIDANLLDVTTDQLKNPELDKEWFLGSLKKLKQRGAGRYFAKEYPTSSAHSGHIKQLLKELKQKKKFKPDIIFLDYINIFTSSRYKTLTGLILILTSKQFQKKCVGWQWKNAFLLCQQRS